MTELTVHDASAGTGPHRPARTPHFHYASMRCAEQSARSLSVQLRARTFLHAVTDEVSAEAVADLKAKRTSFYLLALAHRNAARRLERGQRIRARAERVVRPAVRTALRVRRLVTA